MNFFGVAKMSVIKIDLDGSVSLADDFEENDGVTEIAQMEPNVIAKPGFDEDTCPGKRHPGDWIVVQELKQDLAQMLAGMNLPKHISERLCPTQE